MNIKPKEATSIINSLIGGVVPKIGVQHITVGRSSEINAMVTALEEVKNGHSMVKFWIGDFGSGKSFMLHLLNTVALKQKFVVANADFTPDNRLYSNDGKGVALYAAIMDNIAIQTKPEGGALPTLLEKWIEQLITKTAEDNAILLTEIRDENYLGLIQNNIMKTINEITEVGGFVSMGYSGFMINLDEAINLYKISTSTMREKNYEKILSIYNDCFQGKVGNLFINFAGTKEVLENLRRGFFSYDALKTRLSTNKFETAVIKLLPLDHNEIFVLLKKLKEIFDFNYKTQIDISDDEIQQFMEELFNKPGASEFLTPREVIRDFLNILNIIRQNPNVDKSILFGEVEVYDERPDETGLDGIEEL